MIVQCVMCGFIVKKISYNTSGPGLYQIYKTKPEGVASLRERLYRIRPNFRGAQFPRIALSKHFAETIFMDQEFRV